MCVMRLSQEQGLMKSCELLTLLNSTLRPALRRTGRRTRRTDGRRDRRTSSLSLLLLTICRQLFSRLSRSVPQSGGRTTTSSRGQNSPSFTRKNHPTNSCPKLPGERQRELATPVLVGTSLQHEMSKKAALNLQFAVP